jgi:hypothetical protein
MKYSKTFLFFIILSVALLTTTGFTLKEGLKNNTRSWKEQKGIHRSKIPEGDDHLYVLKSSIVPPVCPKCPQSSACPRQKPCPACPPCARCPEPAFTCKKVPNYDSMNNQYLPLPWLSQASNL